MATDPNKGLRSEQKLIDTAQRVVDGQTAIVSDGQVITAQDDTEYTLTVEGGVVTDIVASP